MKHISRPISLIGIVAGAGLLLAACGGAAGTDDNPPAETDDTTASPDVEAVGDGSPSDAACAAAAGGTTRHWATTDAEVFKEKVKDGKTVMGVIRSTVVVGPDGRVQHAMYDVKPTGHVAALRSELGVD